MLIHKHPQPIAAVLDRLLWVDSVSREQADIGQKQTLD
jgi:hypothetical protein